MVKFATKLTVHGTVQGVFFRNFVKEHADELGLKGHVRNLGGDKLEIVLEGDKDQVERMIEFVKKGPEHSQIRNVSFEERKWSGEFKDFKILRI